MHVRWMIRRDMNEVLDIDRDCFHSPWGEDGFIKMLRQRNIIGMIVELDEKVVGFMVYQLNKRSLHIHRFAASPKGEGTGSEMVNKLKGKLNQQRRNKITVDVPERMLGALNFFKRHDFIATGISGAWDSDEDYIHMVYELMPDGGSIFDQAIEELSV